MSVPYYLLYSMRETFTGGETDGEVPEGDHREGRGLLLGSGPSTLDPRLSRTGPCVNPIIDSPISIRTPLQKTKVKIIFNQTNIRI
jgi:hypothetical protein